MVSGLNWQIQGNNLLLQGVLTDETLRPLWEWMQQPKPAIRVIDVNQLSHVDSAGLALIVYTLEQGYKKGNKIQLSGSNDKLKMLITLYNLDEVISS